jgi:hypothetical protein
MPTSPYSGLPKAHRSLEHWIFRPKATGGTMTTMRTSNTPPLASPAPAGLRLPEAPRSILKGSSLAHLLDREAIECLAHNLELVHPGFDAAGFQRDAQEGLSPLSILRRGEHLARVLRRHLPPAYDDAIEILTRSLTPALSRTEGLGLGVFFYLPHVSFVALYGLDPAENGGRDPFETSMADCWNGQKTRIRMCAGCAAKGPAPDSLGRFESLPSSGIRVQ